MTINRRELLGYSAAALGVAAVGLPQIEVIGLQAQYGARQEVDLTWRPRR